MDSVSGLARVARRTRLREFVESLEENADLRLRLLRVLGTVPAGWRDATFLDDIESIRSRAASNRLTVSRTTPEEPTV